MTIADKLNYLNGTKEAIKQAIANKGVEVLETDTFRSYADKIASIEAGGGSGADYKSSLMATTTQSAYSPSIVSLSDYVLPDYTIEKGQTGLLYKRNTETTEKENFTIVGAAYPKNKVVRSFSSTDYITFSQPIFSTFNSWEIVFKFKINSLNKYQFWLYYPVAFGLDSSNRLHIWRTPTEMISTYTFSAGVDYWVKLEYTGERYIAFYKTTKAGEWIQLITLDDPTKVSTEGYISYIGVNPNVTSEYLYGSVDLAECYVKGGDSFFWTPYETTNEYSLNVPDLSHGYKYSSQALEGLTYTNNILKNTTSSSAGRIDTGVKLKVSADDSWEWCIRFKQTARSSSTSYMLNYGYYQTGPWVSISNANTFLWNIWDGSSYRGGGSSGEIELNTWYTACVGSNGESLFMRYKKDGGEWIECSTNGTPLALNITEGIRIGKPSHDVLFVGEWDFAQSYIKINGKMLWPNDEQKYKGICTKDFMPQAGTNTLNAYHIEYTDGTSECLLGQTEPTGEDIKSVQLLESGLTFEEDKAWMYNEDSEQFE